MQRVGLVAGAQPVPVRIYDYYEPSKYNFYNIFKLVVIIHHTIFLGLYLMRFPTFIKWINYFTRMCRWVVGFNSNQILK